jgi:hypothetical protein
VDSRDTDNRDGSTVYFVGLLILAAGLLCVAATFTRLAGKDMRDASRFGSATVGSCVERGPVSGLGLGYWDSCTATIAWDDGKVQQVHAGIAFTAEDTGQIVRVGDVGGLPGTSHLARDGVAPRPWLAAIGYGVGVLAGLTLLIALWLLRELVRYRLRPRPAVIPRAVRSRPALR